MPLLSKLLELSSLLKSQWAPLYSQMSSVTLYTHSLSSFIGHPHPHPSLFCGPLPCPHCSNSASCLSLLTKWLFCLWLCFCLIFHNFPAVIFFSFSQNAFNISCIPENKNKILIFSKYSSSLSPTLLPTLCRLHFHTPQLCYSLGWLPSGCSLFSFAILLVSLSLYFLMCFCGWPNTVLHYNTVFHLLSSFCVSELF